jgi:hypothetical protein
MPEWLSIYKKEARSSLLTLILLSLGWGLPEAVSPSGQMTLTKEQALKVVGVMVALVIGIFSYTYQLWQRDRKRERVRFAREHGRPICPCTETGEITEVRHVRGRDGPLGRGQEFDAFVCPECGAWSAEPVTMIHGGIDVV